MKLKKITLLILFAIFTIKVAYNSTLKFPNFYVDLGVYDPFDKNINSKLLIGGGTIHHFIFDNTLSFIFNIFLYSNSKNFDNEIFNDPDFTITYSILYLPVLVGLRKEFPIGNLRPYLSGSIGIGITMEEYTHFLNQYDYFTKKRGSEGLSYQIDTGFIVNYSKNIDVIPKIIYHKTTANAIWNDNKVNYSGVGVTIGVSIKIF